MRAPAASSLLVGLLLALACGSVVGQQCGIQASWASCPAGTCCSQHGFCGSTPAYCDANAGCQMDCAVCGDGACVGEDCRTCAQDCGPCPTPGIAVECANNQHYALTFDDGPSGVTDDLLDTLAARGVVASFFVIGNQVPSRAATLARAVNEGHYVASHSYSHPDMATLSLDDVRAQVTQADAAIREAVCVRPTVFRPPYGSLTAEGRAVVEQLGYKVVNWNLDTFDWKHAATDPQKVLDLVQQGLDGLWPGSIIHLQHDRTAESVSLVPQIIDKIEAKGYTFVTVPECLYGVGSNAAAVAYYNSDCPKATPPDNSDCVVSDWSAWSTCPTVCNSEKRIRSRFIVSPATGTGTCTPPLTEEQQCDNPCGCGDGECNLDETCHSCSLDCGPCQPRGIRTACTRDHHFAMTFDDGPSSVTSVLLDTLAARGVKATFFVLGLQVEKASLTPIMQRAFNEGHSIASHTYSHRDMATLSLADVREELVKNDRIIRSAVCVKPRVMRPPYGSVDADALDLIQKMGYVVLNWNLDTKDWQYASENPSVVLDRVDEVTTNKNPSPIVHLQHDLLIESVNLVDDIITMVQGKGYDFVTLDDCVFGVDTRNASRAFQHSDCPLPTSATGSCVLSEWSDWDGNCPNSCEESITTRRRYVMETIGGGCVEPLVETAPCNNTCHCGDGSCNLNETCTTCATDCGPCQPDTAGGGLVATGCMAPNQLALTFSGGPSDLTNTLLNRLATAGVNATFFLSPAAFDYAPVVARMVAEGHVVGCELAGLTTGLSISAMRRELAAASGVVEAVTCARPRYARVPADVLGDEASLLLVEELGWKTVKWNLDSKDTELPSASAIKSEVSARLSELAPAGVIHIQHDTVAASMSAVVDIINSIKGFGYKFVDMHTCLYGNTSSTAAPVAFMRGSCATGQVQLPNSDCIVSQWSTWSRCSASCAGTTTRSRVVTVPETGTGTCTVPLSETKACSPPCAFCGDGMCTDTETCLTCGLDCGPCQTAVVSANCVTVNHYAITINARPTTDILNALAAKSAPATFFVTGDQAREDNSTLGRAVDEGHTIGSGGNNATSMLTMPAEWFPEAVTAAEDAIMVAACRRPRIIRPPGGRVTRKGVIKLASMGYRTVTWNLDTDLVPASTLRDLVRTLNTSHLSVVHQMSPQSTVEHINTVIDEARNSGFTLVNMNKCLFGNTGALKPASVAYSAQPTIRSPPHCHAKWATTDNANCVMSMWSPYSACPNRYTCESGGLRTRTRVVASPKHGSGVPCNPSEMTQTGVCSDECSCGDGTCNGGESCGSCPADCGPCPPNQVVSTCVDEGDKVFVLGMVGFPYENSWDVLNALASGGAKASLFVDPDLVAGSGAGVVQAAAFQGHAIGSDVYGATLHSIKPGQGFRHTASELLSWVADQTCLHLRDIMRPRPPAKLAPSHVATLTSTGHTFLNYTWAPPSTSTRDELIVGAQAQMLTGAPVVAVLDARMPAVLDALPGILTAIGQQGYQVITADECRSGRRANSSALTVFSEFGCGFPASPGWVNNASVCEYSDWGAWTACSATCGGGTQTRSAVLLPAEPGSCASYASESRACNTQLCGNHNCTLGEWSEWEACPTECVNATVSRTRSVTVPAVGQGKCTEPTVEVEDCPICVCTQAIVLEPAAGVTVTEGGTTPATYRVWMNCQPDDWLTVAITVPLVGQEYISVTPDQLLFAPDKWTRADAGLVRVAAPDNDYNEGPRPLTVDHHAYSGGQVGRKAVMKVTVNDNDYDPDADDFDSTPTAIIDTTTFIRPVGDVGTVTLSATSSFDADGDSVNFHWTVDQEASTAPAASVAAVNIISAWVAATAVVDMNEAGLYVITVAVSDARNHIGRASAKIFVLGFPDPPVLPPVCVVGMPCHGSVKMVGLPDGASVTISSFVVHAGVGVAVLPVFTRLDLVGDKFNTVNIALPWQVTPDLPVGDAYSMRVIASVRIGGKVAYVHTTGGSTSLTSGFEWNVTAWRGCSPSCGPGRNTRGVTCVNSTSREALADMVCIAAGLEKPLSGFPCMVTTCAPAEWRVSAWSACSSVPCGTASSMTRTVECVNALLTVIGDSHCVSAGLLKPASQRVCPPKTCDAFEWVLTPWRKCSAQCGTTGVQYRSWECRTTGSTKGAVTGDKCRAAGVELTATQAAQALVRECNRVTCPGVYVSTGAWGPCSARCGGGVTTRTSTCWLDGGVAPMSTCVSAGVTIPATSRQCNVVACSAAVPDGSAWTDCDSDCDGSRSRQFSCISDTLTPLSWSICAATGAVALPVQRESCGSACDFCANNTCSSRGTCSNGACKCLRGFSGPKCETRVDCGDKMMNKDGNCCPGVVTTLGVCCPTATDVLDASGGCCAVDLLDACGVCNGTSTAVDARGVCCSGVLDAGGICCPAPHEVDLCGVCGGVNACAQRLRLRFSIPSYLTATGIATLLEPSRVLFVTEVAGLVSASFGVDAERVLVGQSGVYHPGRRLDSLDNLGRQELLDSIVTDADDQDTDTATRDEPELESTVDSAQPRRLTHLGMWVEVRVMPPGDGVGGNGQSNYVEKPVLAPALQTQAASQSLSMTFIEMLYTDMTGVCGNGVCEVDERCSSLSNPEPNCCLADCHIVFASCPVGPRGEACNGAGKCITGVNGEGRCVCFDNSGFMGDDCGTCMPGLAGAGSAGWCSHVSKGAFVIEVDQPPILVGNDAAVAAQVWVGYLLLGVGVLLGACMVVFIVKAVAHKRRNGDARGGGRGGVTMDSILSLDGVDRATLVNIKRNNAAWASLGLINTGATATPTGGAGGGGLDIKPIDPSAITDERDAERRKRSGKKAKKKKKKHKRRDGKRGRRRDGRHRHLADDDRTGSGASFNSEGRFGARVASGSDASDYSDYSSDGSGDSWDRQQRESPSRGGVMTTSDFSLDSHDRSARVINASSDLNLSGRTGPARRGPGMMESIRSLGDVPE